MPVKLAAFLIALLLVMPLSAQPGRTTLLASNIHALQLSVDGDAERFPIIKLDGSETLKVSFDDLTHEYRRYTYHITQCNPDGTPNEDLFESEYVNATADEEVIEDYAYSQNTTVLYTHYSFTLPNAHMRPLLSGCYKITVSTENDEGDVVPVIETYFGVLDQRVFIRPTCDTDTEIDHNAAHQQLTLSIDCSALQLRDAHSEIYTTVQQNRRFDNAVINPPCTAQNGNVLLWEHTRRLIFPAGNEYRKMEMISTNYPGLHGESMRWYEPFYHYTLQTDFARPNYLYDEERDGHWLPRCDTGGDADVEADYVLVHYTLDHDPLLDGRIYVSGAHTPLGLRPENEMRYNAETRLYECTLLQKLGYYNYLYLYAPSTSPAVGQTAPIEGDYFQTENEYDILVYHRPTGSRYYALVGCVTPIYRR